MKNILLVCGEDENYIAVARAIQSLLDTDTYNVEIARPCIERGTFAKLHSAFLSAQRHSLSWKITNSIWWNKKLAEASKDLVQENLNSLLKYSPDLIVSLHPLYSGFVKYAAIELSVPSVVFVSDPTKVHKAWVYADLHIVAVPFDITKLPLFSHQKAQVITYPIHTSFIDIGNETVQELFSSYHLEKQHSVSVFPCNASWKDESMIKDFVLSFPSNKNLFIVDIEKKVSSHTKEYIASLQKQNIVLVEDAKRIPEVLLMSDIVFCEASPSLLFAAFAADAMPYVFEAKTIPQKSLLHMLKEKNLVRTIHKDGLKKHLEVDNSEFEEYKKQAREFLEDTHIYTEKKLFNDFFDNIFR